MFQTRFFRLVCLLALLGLLSIPVLADSTIYTRISMRSMEGILQEMKVEYEQVPSRDGSYFRLYHDGWTLVLFLWDEGSNLQLYGAFSVRQSPSLSLINDWNREYRFGRAYLDREGDPVLESDLDLEGGATRGGIKEYIMTFFYLFEIFHEHLK